MEREKLSDGIIKAMKFIFVHGSFSTPQDHWFPWLKETLETLGHSIIAPQFPVDQWSRVSRQSVEAYIPTQNLDSWMSTFASILPQLSQQKELCFVGHSIGPLFMLHVVMTHALQVAHAFCVAPFLRPASKDELKDKATALVDKANKTFYKKDFDFYRLRTYIPDSTVIYSDDDPYVPEYDALEFAQKLGSTTVKLSGLGHMGTESNLCEFSELLEIIKKELR